MEVKEGNGKSVLVVEGEPCIATVCMRILIEEGFQVGRRGKLRVCLRHVEGKRL